MSIMHAVMGCIAASGDDGERFAITYGHYPASDYRGYSDGIATPTAFGGISPGSLNGVAIRVIMWTGSNRLIVCLDGDRPINFFSRIRCALGDFDSADANHNYLGANNYTRWLWGNVSDSFPTSGNGQIVFY